MPSIGNIQEREISQEMRDSYLDYAMSVIVMRALPDVRDGLKPVHRRILFVMHELGLHYNTKFTKSANVVGNSLARYHPHGDTALYDAMVRMAQDFSLRYPLVDGQGNFGCFTKDTKIQLTDGRGLSFEDLVKEHEAGIHNFTYTINNIGLVSITEVKNPRLTHKNAELIRVTLDNGTKIRCTPNHLFMKRDGSYKEARHLASGESLMPLYQRLSEKSDRLNRAGYTLIHQPKTNEWIPAHHLADNYNLTHKIYQKSAGRVRHHKNFHKQNNNPTNIIRLNWEEHWRVHYEHAAEQHADPEYRKKIADGRKAYWSQPLVRKAYAERLSRRNRENWNNPTYREHMRIFLSEVNKRYIQEHPEKRQEISARATKTLKKMWQDAGYRAFMHEKIIQGNKNHTSNLTGKKKFLAICREAISRSAYLDEKSYESARSIIYPYGAATRWETGLQKYFQNHTELIFQEIKHNHKVIKVEPLTEYEDVYDLTIDGTHNFALAAGIFVHNSIDGDSAAAHRYTEARMTRIAEELLRDIEKDTVAFRDSYDGSRQEPAVLPSAVPNLLLNGTIGIAVGMATNIPPHNLTEVIDGLTHLIDHPSATTDDLMEFIKGPDFPTGGIIYNEKEIRQAYATGKGAILNRGKAEIEESKKGYQIVVSEVPYQVNKAEWIEKIAGLVQDKKLEGIRDLRDESDRDGLRVVIELKADAQPQKVLNNLYRHTDLEKNFHLNMLALVDGIQPQILSVRDVLEEFIKHRIEVVTRRTQFDLARTRERIHILEGLKKALDHIDRVIDTIKKSRDRDDARVNLIKKFSLSEIQAVAILEMRLQTLAGLERQNIEDELKEKLALAASLEALLKDSKKIRSVVKTELAEVKEKFGDERRTKVVKSSPKEFSDEDLIPEEEVAVMLTRGGYIKRIKPDQYRMQKRGGKGLIGIETKEEDVVEHLLTCSTHAELLFFTDTGKVYQVPCYEIPEGSRISKGKAIFNFLSLNQQDRVTSILGTDKSYQGRGKKKSAGAEQGAASAYIVMLTKHGIIKKVPAGSFEHVRKSGLIAMTLKNGDMLGWARRTSGKDELLLVTKKGQAIRFSERDVRPMGRQAAGVTALRLKQDDEIVGMDMIDHTRVKGDDSRVLIIMEQGFGKQASIRQYKKQRRGGSGIKTAKVTAKTGNVVSAQIIGEDYEELIAISRKGQVIRTALGSIPALGRATQGVRVMKMDAGDAVASITTL